MEFLQGNWVTIAIAIAAIFLLRDPTSPLTKMLLPILKAIIPGLFGPTPTPTPTPNPSPNPLPFPFPFFNDGRRQLFSLGPDGQLVPEDGGQVEYTETAQDSEQAPLVLASNLQVSFKNGGVHLVDGDRKLDLVFSIDESGNVVIEAPAEPAAKKR